MIFIKSLPELTTPYTFRLIRKLFWIFNIDIPISYVLIRPGDAIQLEVMSTDPVKFKALNGARENDFLLSFGEINEESSNTVDVYGSMAYDYDEYMDVLDQRFAPFEDFTSRLEEEPEVSEEFKELLKKRLWVIQKQLLGRYPSTYEYYNDTLPELPAGFNNDYTLERLNDPDLLQFHEGRSAIENWHSQDVDYKEYPTLGKYFDATNENSKIYGSTLVGQYATHAALLNQLQVGSGINSVETAF